MLRNRSRGSFSRPFNSSITRTLCNGSSTVVSTGVVDIDVGLTETMSDIVTPRFQRLRDRGGIANNPMTKVMTEKTGSASGSLFAQYIPSCSGTGTKTETQSLFISRGYPSFPIDWKALGDAEQAAVSLSNTQAMANVVSPEVQGLVELAELSKTLHMLRHPLNNVHKLLNNIRNSRSFLRSGKSLGDYISSEWLKYRYGITPLCMSMQDIIKTATTEKKGDRFTARGTSSRSVARESASTIVNTYSWSTATHTGYREGKVTCRSGVLYEHHFTAADRYGTSVSEIPSAAWELVPYSFVFDWFINTGDFIRAITPKANVKVLASWTSLKTETTIFTQEQSAPRSVPNWSISDNRLGNQTTVTTTVRRTPGVSANLAVNQILFDKNRDWLHLADLLSLVTQRLQRR